MVKTCCFLTDIKDYRQVNEGTFRVHWQLTHRCNLSCLHCISDAVGPYDKVKEVTTEEAKRIIDNLSSLNVSSILFTGGEPLLRNDFFEIANYAYDYGFNLLLSTNGTLVDQEKLNKLYTSY